MSGVVNALNLAMIALCVVVIMICGSTDENSSHETRVVHERFKKMHQKY